MSLSPQIYRLTSPNVLFEDVNVLLISLASLATAASVHVDGIVCFNAGDYLTIEGRHLDLRVRLPIHGPVEVALSNKKPDLIEISVLVGRGAERNYAVVSGGFANYIDTLFRPFLVTFFQRYRSEIENKFTKNRLAWPSSWQMGWAVRNAISHGGVAFERLKQKPVAWRGLVFGPSDEPRNTLLNLLNGADLLILLLDMEEEIAQAAK